MRKKVRMVQRDVVNDEEKAAVIVITMGVDIGIEIIAIARPLCQGVVRARAHVTDIDHVRL